MNITDVIQIIKKSEGYKELEKWVTSSSKCLKIGGTQGSAPALFVHTAQKAAQLPAVYILHDAEEAGYFYGDLCQLSDQNVYYFPSSYKKKIKDGLTKDAPNQVLRTEALSALQGDAPVTLVTYPEALTELVIAPALLSKETLQLKVGNTLSTDYVIELLLEYGFTQTDFVYEPGQFSVRGSLIDVFSFSNDVPYRIDFFGDDIDSIRTFDIESQLSIESLNEIAIVSSTVNTTQENLVPIFQFFIPYFSALPLPFPRIFPSARKYHIILFFSRHDTILAKHPYTFPEFNFLRLIILQTSVRYILTFWSY